MQWSNKSFPYTLVRPNLNPSLVNCPDGDSNVCINRDRIITVIITSGTSKKRTALMFFLMNTEVLSGGLCQTTTHNTLYFRSFLRGMPQLTRMMKRVQPHLGKMVPNIEGEPNFYDMDSKHPLPAPSAAMTHQMSYSYEYFPPMYANNVAPPPQYNPYYGHNMPMPAQPSSNVPSHPQINPYYNSNMAPPAQPYPDYYDYSVTAYSFSGYD